MRKARPGRLLGSIGFTILVFNVLLVFLPVAAFFFLGTYERQLLASLERAMSEQALMISSALSGGGGDLAARANAFLGRLARGHEARIRVFSPDGGILADSARAVPGVPGETGRAVDRETRTARTKDQAGRESLIYRIGSWPVRVARRILSRPADRSAGTDLYDRNAAFASSPEIASALSGRYGATTRILPGEEGSTVRLYSAMPVNGPESVAGVVLVSQSTSRILADIYAMRIEIFRIFLLSVAVAVALSLVSDLLLARPLRKLSGRAARILDGRGRIRGTFPAIRALNEIGSLSRSLADMSAKLELHTGFLESFSQDLAHEIRNPLASVRASLELLAEGEADGGKRGLIDRARSDVDRINHLVGDVRELTNLDAEDTGLSRDPCRPAAIARNAAEGFRRRHPGTPLVLRVSEDFGTGEGPVMEGADPRRFLQALENLLENAASFAPPGSPVDLDLSRSGEGKAGRWILGIRDRGPGFPEEDAERMFDRFYSSRKDDGLHTGLGLAIVRSIASGMGGSVRAELADPGARFVMEGPFGRRNGD